MDSQYKIIHPAKYLRDHFALSVRPDGRDLKTFRPVSINVGSITHADSSAVFKIGNTSVICGIKAELAQPKAETPHQGFIVPNVELSPLSNPRFRPGPPCEEAQHITKIVERILVSSKAIDLKDLCIHKDKLAWVLYCDIVCVDFDGSVIDASLGALMSALQILTLPTVEYTVESNVIKVDAKKRIRVPLNRMAASSTFAFFEDQLLVVDPTDDEEQLSLGTITIAFTEEEMCFLHKAGGIPISHSHLSKCVSKAKNWCEKIRKAILTATEDCS